MNEPSTRENLSFRVMYTGDSLEILRLANFVKNQYNGKSGIIYCPDEAYCEELSRVMDAEKLPYIHYKRSFCEDEIYRLNSRIISWVSFYFKYDLQIEYVNVSNFCFHWHF